MSDAICVDTDLSPARIETKLGWHFVDLSDFEFNLVIALPPFSWKRARKVITVAGHPSIGHTLEARRWAYAAVGQLASQWGSVFGCPIPISVELNAAIVSYLPNKRRVDSSNLYQGPEDVMQTCTGRCKPGCRWHAQIITDDWQIRTHEGSDRRLDRDSPRVEITLTPYRRRGVR